jgi:hypothetical protein
MVLLNSAQGFHVATSYHPDYSPDFRRRWILRRAGSMAGRRQSEQPRGPDHAVIVIALLLRVLGIY